MKKFLLAILAVGAVATAQAQKAGSIFLYGSAGYTGYKNTDDDGLPGTSDLVTKNRDWHIAPGVGFQLNKNWGVGLNFGVGINTKTVDDGSITTDDRMRGLMVGPFVRYTMPLNRTFFVFNQINVSYLNAKSTYDDGVAGTPDIESSANGFGANWMPAIGVNISRCMALTFDFGGLGYTKLNWDMTGPREVNESEFNFNFGRTFNLGIQANFGGHSGRRHHGGMEPGMERRRMDTSDDDSEEDAPKKRSSSDIEE